MLDVLVLALGCTLTKDERQLATSSIVSAKQGVLEFNRATGVKALVMVGSGYFDYAARGAMVEGTMMASLVKDEVPAFVEPYSYNTVVNAIYVGMAIKKIKVGKVMLASDPLHSKRAVKTFREVWKALGINVEIVPAPAEMPVYGDSNKWFLTKKSYWFAWNQIGLLLLPGQVGKIKKALASQGV